MPTGREQERFCVIIPAYCEQQRIHWVVKGVRQFCDDVIVVDDGSPDDTAAQAELAGATVVKHDTNCGKGVALKTGLDYARDQGFDYLVTMDGDGQHSPDDIPRFVEAYLRTGIPVLVGNRMTDARGIPFFRRITNYLLTWILNGRMNWYVPDTQCGFRLYRCDVIPYLSARSRWRAAESEMLLHIADRGIRIDSVPVQVIYSSQKNHFMPIRDMMRFLFMLWRYGWRRTRSASVRGVSG